MKLTLATHNAHKVDELRRIIGGGLGAIELVAYDGPQPIEDGASFAENALIKARAAAEHTGGPAIADDSGIVVPALGGEPGIRSARYAGTGVDRDNYLLLLERMGAVTERTAEFHCAAALVDGDFEHVEVGVWPGRVLEEPRGEGGFGYDPVFQPDGLEVASAELTADEKNAISHRARAFAALLPVIVQRLG